jgi:multiple sugar transport system permease protein
MLTGKVAMTAAAPQGSQLALADAPTGPTQPVRSPKRRRRGRSPRTGRVQNIVPWLYLLVPLGLLITFVYVPVFNLFYYSVTNWDGITPNPSLVGLANYKEIFTDSAYFDVFKVAVYYLIASVLQIGMALYFATILSFNIKFRNFWKGVLFFPYLINGVAISFVFLYFFQPGGTLDSVLRLFGYHNEQLWLGNPHWANVSLAGVSIWRYMGLNFVLFLGAIQSIPSMFYEASELDGANRWHQFRYIIVPAIRPIISLSFILAISGSLAVFEIPYIMTGGANGTNTFVIQTIQTAFQFQQVGLASALAVVLLLIVLAVTWVQRLLSGDDDVELA